MGLMNFIIGSERRHVRTGGRHPGSDRVKRGGKIRQDGA